MLICNSDQFKYTGPYSLNTIIKIKLKPSEKVIGRPVLLVARTKRTKMKKITCKEGYPKNLFQKQCRIHIRLIAYFPWSF
jgi:hypothetical protein